MPTIRESAGSVNTDALAWGSIWVLLFAKSSCTTLKGFLSPWRRFFGLGLHADSSIRENARGKPGLCLAGFQKRIWLSEKQLLNLRCHRITMV
jgi:hypothetical protein